jgi:hypothetical protein
MLKHKFISKKFFNRTKKYFSNHFGDHPLDKGEVEGFPRSRCLPGEGRPERRVLVQQWGEVDQQQEGGLGQYGAEAGLSEHSGHRVPAPLQLDGRPPEQPALVPFALFYESDFVLFNWKLEMKGKIPIYYYLFYLY